MPHNVRRDCLCHEFGCYRNQYALSTSLQIRYPSCNKRVRSLLSFFLSFLNNEHHLTVGVFNVPLTVCLCQLLMFKLVSPCAADSVCSEMTNITNILTYSKTTELATPPPPQTFQNLFQLYFSGSVARCPERNRQSDKLPLHIFTVFIIDVYQTTVAEMSTAKIDKRTTSICLHIYRKTSSSSSLIMIHHGLSVKVFNYGRHHSVFQVELASC